MLTSAAATAEAMFVSAADQARAGDSAIAMLGTTAARAKGGSDRNLATYCAAVGEAYRIGRDGNPYQARALLLAAFRHGEAAASPALSALAAYRLGLTAEGGGVTGARGLRRSIAASPEGAAPPSAASATCDRLVAPDAESGGGAYFTTLALRCAIDRASAGGDDALAARAGLGLARFWLAYGRRAPAEAEKARANAGRIALEALGAASRIADPAARAEVLSRIAETAIDAGRGGDTRLDGVADAIRAAAGGDPALADAVAGRVALARGDPARAAGALRRAIFLESQSAFPLRLSDWYLLLAQAEPARRAEHVAHAYRALQAVRPLLVGNDALTEESNFALHIRPVYEMLLAVRLDAADAGGTDAAQRIAEEYRQAELQSLFGSECVPARPPVTPAELKPGEVLLYPVLLPDRVELLYATGGEASAHYLRLSPTPAVARDAIVADIAAMTDATSFGDPDGWRAPARRLYAALVAPIADRLAPGGTLVVVPDGPLSALPFAALVDERGRFLVERTRVDVVPSLAYAQPGADRAGASVTVVAAALEKEEKFAFGTYGALAGTLEEARAAAGMTGGGGGHGILLENFRRADLVRALAARRVDVLHLATHASFNGRSDRSYIVADGELIPIAELRAMIERNQARGDQLDLIVLSACESAVGDDEATMGLAGAAVQAGARSALASLWQVNDAGTAALMTGFYARYRAGAGKAEALRGAQLALIGRGGAFADPNIWAAFTLLGGWR